MSFIIDPYRFGTVVSPNDFPGLVRWYKADSYALADNDRVGGAGREWIDQSASGEDATQPVAGNRPYFSTNVFGSLPAIVFTPGDNSWLEMTGLVLPDTFTIISIAKANANTTLVGSLTQNIWIRLKVSTTNLDTYDGANNMQSNVFTTAFNSVNMSSWRRDGVGLYSFRERDIDRGDFLAGSLLSQTYTELGGTTGGGGGDASLGELCIWNTRLSDANVDSLYLNYFKNKWGLP